MPSLELVTFCLGVDSDGSRCVSVHRSQCARSAEAPASGANCARLPNRDPAPTAGSRLAEAGFAAARHVPAEPGRILFALSPRFPVAFGPAEALPAPASPALLARIHQDPSTMRLAVLARAVHRLAIGLLSTFIALLATSARYSARLLNADRRLNLLIWLEARGSKFDA